MNTGQMSVAAPLISGRAVRMADRVRSKAGAGPGARRDPAQTRADRGENSAHGFLHGPTGRIHSVDAQAV
jgi:hypothetical protein